MVAAIAESLAAIVLDHMATTSTSTTTTVPDTLNVLDIGCGDCSSGRALVSAITSGVSRLTHTCCIRRRNAAIHDHGSTEHATLRPTPQVGFDVRSSSDIFQPWPVVDQPLTAPGIGVMHRIARLIVELTLAQFTCAVAFKCFDHTCALSSRPTATLSHACMLFWDGIF
jgi:hypothetical protein